MGTRTPGPTCASQQTSGRQGLCKSTVGLGRNETSHNPRLTLDEYGARNEVARVVVRPVNRLAAEKANDYFYRRHRELVSGGRRVRLDVCNPNHDRHRAEWINYYIRFGGLAEVKPISHTCDLNQAFSSVSLVVEMTGSMVGELRVFLEDPNGNILVEEVSEILGKSKISLNWTLPSSRGRYEVRAVFGVTAEGRLENDKELREITIIREQIRKGQAFIDKELNYKGGWMEKGQDFVSSFSPSDPNDTSDGYQAKLDADYDQQLKNRKIELQKLDGELLQLEQARKSREIVASRKFDAFPGIQFESVTLANDTIRSWRAVKKRFPGSRRDRGGLLTLWDVVEKQIKRN